MTVTASQSPDPRPGPDGTADLASIAAAARRRRLRRLAGDSGVIAGIALDHRDSLLAVLGRQGVNGLTTAELRVLKRTLVRVLAPAATAVMLDAELGSLALEDDSIPPSVGLVMPLEAQGYEAQGDRRLTTLLDDFSPADAARSGADACKLLIPYRIDDEPAAAQQDALVVSTVAACHAVGLPLVIEPVVHRLSAEPADVHAAKYPNLVIEAVRRLRPLGADLLKLPFPIRDGAPAAPAARTACRGLAAACGDTPWVLLGGSADPGDLLQQIRLAGEAGASGFLLGRSIWGAALDRDPDRTRRLAAGVALPAFERCREAAEGSARSVATGPG